MIIKYKYQWSIIRDYSEKEIENKFRIEIESERFCQINLKTQHEHTNLSQRVLEIGTVQLNLIPVTVKFKLRS